MWWLGMALLGAVAASIHDNHIGGPETVLSVDDPSSPLYNLISPMPYAGGTYHFVSSTFPEVDSRGFHGGMFDGIGDYYPVWPSVYYKRYHKRGDEEIGDGYRSGQRKKRSLDQTPKDPKENFMSDSGEKLVVEKRGRNGGRIVRGMEMSSSGFHGDVFNSGFGDFSTMKRRSYEPFKRSLKTLSSPISIKEDTTERTTNAEKETTGMDIGLHWSPADPAFALYDKPKKRRPEMDAMGFHGDTFGGGFGDFDTMKKRRPEMDAMGFHGDTFGGGFGDFDTMKKRRPEMDAMGFHGDTFGGGFGDFDTMKKRRPEMDAMGFHGDTFGGGFGDFDTMKKRRPEMDAMGFHGDTFGGGFGDFDTMKKRRPEMDAMGFHGDTFGGGFGDFDTMKKRRPEMDAMGFHGDTFGGGFGDFDTMKKRRPEMDAMGFHGDTFGGGFGDFDTMKKRQSNFLQVKPWLAKQLETRLRNHNLNVTLQQLQELFASKPILQKYYESKGVHTAQFPPEHDVLKYILAQRSMSKRRPEMDAMGFHGGVFSNGFGDFETMKKSDPRFSRGF